MRKRILLASDIHHCHLTWYGLSSEERMERLIRDLNAEYRRDPYEVILFLGDYSLDFWEWDTKGCYLNEGRSYTREFVEKVCPRLPSPYLMIPGNHEQYGEDMWRSLTGCSRKGVWTTDGWLFILLDNFSANLDPQQHSDGTFTPIDVDYVREQMDAYPDRRVVLCSHHFDFEKETPEGCRLVQDPRIVCLASGHVHLSDIVTLPDALGGKKILRTGHYSYAAAPNPLKFMHGFREMILTEDALFSRYITPANRIVLDGKAVDHPYGTQDEVRIPLSTAGC